MSIRPHTVIVLLLSSLFPFKDCSFGPKSPQIRAAASQKSNITFPPLPPTFSRSVIQIPWSLNKRAMWEHVGAKSACHAVSRGNFIESVFIHLWCGAFGITKKAFCLLVHFINAEKSDKRVVNDDPRINVNGKT